MKAVIFLLLLESIWCSLAVHSPPTRLERNVVNLNSIVARGEAPEEGEGYIGLNTEENTQHKTQARIMQASDGGIPGYTRSELRLKTAHHATSQSQHALPQAQKALQDTNHQGVKDTMQLAQDSKTIHANSVLEELLTRSELRTSLNHVFHLMPFLLRKFAIYEQQREHNNLLKYFEKKNLPYKVLYKKYQTGYKRLLEKLKQRKKHIEKRKQMKMHKYQELLKNYTNLKKSAQNARTKYINLLEHASPAKMKTYVRKYFVLQKSFHELKHKFLKEKHLLWIYKNKHNLIKGPNLDKSSNPCIGMLKKVMHLLHSCWPIRSGGCRHPRNHNMRYHNVLLLQLLSHPQFVRCFKVVLFPK